jgi:methylaspartate mutase sigma subunit
LSKGKGITVVLGTIGVDAHIVGSWVLKRSLENEGIKVVYLGAAVSQEEFINAAVETNADSIWVSSLYGMGRFECKGLREKCVEAGLKDILLYAGGMLVSSMDLVKEWGKVEQEFEEMGFNRIYRPGTRPDQPIADLKKDMGMVAKVSKN